MYLFAYNMGSAGAKELSDRLKIKRIRHENSIFRGNPNKTVINWGSSEVPDEVLKCKILNHPEVVLRASNKLFFFHDIHNHNSHHLEQVIMIPQWTTSVGVALDWVGDGNIVFARGTLTGHSGEGITIVETTDQLPQARLYTKYIPKKEEYRIHFVGKEIIDIQRKALRSDVNKDNVNWKVRNLNNGFIFARENLTVPNCVIEQANRYINFTSLDFGALDLIWNQKSDTAYILEVNTAPGLQGTSVEKYAEAFSKYEAKGK